VFCGSSPGVNPAYMEAAGEVGRLIAHRGLGLVYGGACVGMMGAIADAALEAGAEVIGVIPDALLSKEVAHANLTELRIVSTMHERKALMAELADGFLALPGGCGTFDELFEVITWAQIGIHNKPCGLLNVAGYFDPLIALVEHAVKERFVRHDHRALLLNDNVASRLLDAMMTYKPVTGIKKWMDADGV
jgi:uncharacterized protein (TIGR00730 family)